MDEPSGVAEQFAAAMTTKGYQLDFSLESLQGEVDRVLDDYEAAFRQDEAGHALETALAAYVGETLARLYDGTWGGTFQADNPAANFYTSHVDFGEYRYRPTHFIAYRISNGPAEGTFADQLERVLPKIIARVEDGS